MLFVEHIALTMPNVQDASILVHKPCFVVDMGGVEEAERVAHQPPRARSITF